MVAFTQPLFSLGQVVATPGALQALEEAAQTPSEFLQRHVTGDWGCVDDEDKAANDLALKDGTRILSAYLLKSGTKIWNVTEALGDGGRRASTCVLLPEEY